MNASTTAQNHFEDFTIKMKVVKTAQWQLNSSSMSQQTTPTAAVLVQVCRDRSSKY